MSDLTEKQFASIRGATCKVNLWEGAVSSGKTIGSLVAFLMAVAKAPMRGEIVVIGRTRDTVGRNLLGPLQDPTLFGEAAREVHYNAGSSWGRVLGRKVHVLGASDARAESVLRGLTVSVAYVDELTLISEPFWKMLLSRMRVEGARIFATTNPDGPAHWAKKTIVDKAEALGYSRFHFVIDDNPFLPDGYVAQLKREYTGLWYRRFILGEWVQAEGAVYTQWDPTRHVVPHATLPVMERVVALGVDHGTTNPTRGVLIGVAEGRLWAIDEWAPATGLPDVVQSSQMRAWQAARELELWRYPEWVYVDPAAASFRAQLFSDGVTPAAAHNAVLPGIRTVGSLLSTDKLVVSDRCAHLIKYLPGYVWDSKATAKGEDKPVKLDDHEVDALRYAVHSSRAFWRDTVPLSAAAPGAPGSDAVEAA